MGTNPTKAAGNIYCRCRKEAAKYDDRLNSREGAAELLGASPSTVADWELGLTKYIPVDRIVAMADLYNAPELKNYYCTHECPIGKECMHQLELAELDRLTLQILAALNDIPTLKSCLVEIAADGKITADERPQLDVILTNLDQIVKAAQEMQLWAEKTLGT